MQVLAKPNVPQIDMDTTPPYINPLIEGQMRWSRTDGTLDIGLKNGVTLQSGQELHFYAKASAAIGNGKACQFVGAEGDHILVKEAVGSEITANPQYFVGVSTQAIAAGEFGYITWFGYVNDVYTTGTAGTSLYVDPDTTTGALTTNATNAIVEAGATVRVATGGAENGRILVRPTIKNNIGDTVPVGSIIAWGTNTAPTNWLICDGSAVSRTTYSVLFGVIGTTYGAGNGSTTFNLPNIKGRTVVGRDAVQTEFDTLGETGGAKTHTLTVDQMPSHTHATVDGGSSSDYSWYAASGGPYNIQTANLMLRTSGSTGGGLAHNNLQPYIVENYIIKAFTSSSVTALVVDNMLSTSATDALSANQGKILRDTLNSVYLPVDYNAFRVTSNTTITNGATVPITKLIGGLTVSSNLITLEKGYAYEMLMDLDYKSPDSVTGEAVIDITNTSNVSQLQRRFHKVSVYAISAAAGSLGRGFLDLSAAASNLQVKVYVESTTTGMVLDSAFGGVYITKMKKVTI